MNLNISQENVEVGGQVSRRGPTHGPVSQVNTRDEQRLHGAGSKATEVVEALYRNEELLARFLSSRRLNGNTEGTYRSALKSFSDLVEATLEGAGRAEFEEWFRRADALGLAASSMVVYAVRLRKVLEYTLQCGGMSRVKAQAEATLALEGVPLEDLRREAKLHERWLDKLLSLEELDALIREAVHPRTRALVPVLYESACRKGEILAALVCDVTIGEAYSTIRVFGKTGQRTLPLIRSVPALKAWLEVHPDPRPRAPLFATVWRGEIRRMGDDTPNRLMIDLAERVGIRHVYPHQLRHTRLTELAAAGIGEYVLKSFAGWTPSSNMAARYIHFSGRTHIPAILRLEGIDIENNRSTSVTDIYGALGIIYDDMGVVA